MPETLELSFADVVSLLDGLVADRAGHLGFHGAFWRGVSRDVFVNTPPIRDIVPIVVGDSANSGIVQALRGEGSFSPENGCLSRMPVDGPFLTREEIDAIARWIDRGCPE